jgi:hypothetical protein
MMFEFSPILFDEFLGYCLGFVIIQSFNFITFQAMKIFFDRAIPGN